MKLLEQLIIGLLIFILNGCSIENNESAKQLIIEDEASLKYYEDLIDEYQGHFLEYSLPNSQARIEGFDLSAHLDSIKNRMDTIAQQFYTVDKLTLLERYIDNDTDYVNIIGMLVICHDSELPKGQQIIHKYRKCSQITKKRLSIADCELLADLVETWFYSE
ncbi:MAG: hypothetical protein N4A35_02705 [Flavobacteriales bacterium]|jgi:hypothetical protein|nr:hypothetical protein [Flavobacteriales bacterium]